jgi:hypothetical protein
MTGASSGAAAMGEDFLASVLKRWRSATTSAQQVDAEDMQQETRIADAGNAAPLQPTSAGGQPLPHGRKRQQADALDISRAFEGDTARLPHD